MLFHRQSDVSLKAAAVDLLAVPPASGSGLTPSRKLHIQAKARHHKDVRNELMSTSAWLPYIALCVSSRLIVFRHRILVMRCMYARTVQEI